MKHYYADRLLRSPSRPLLCPAAAVSLIVWVCATNATPDGLRRPETVREGVAAVGRAPATSSSVFAVRSLIARRSNGAAVSTFRPPFQEPRSFRAVPLRPGSTEPGKITQPSTGSSLIQPRVDSGEGKEQATRPFSGSAAAQRAPSASTQPASEMNISRGVLTNPLVANQFRGIINQRFAARDSLIKSGDPAHAAERKRSEERSHAVLIEFIDLGYAPWLVAGWCDNLFADQIVPGMPLDLVEAYWGDPLSIQTSGPEEILTYPFGILYRQVILVGGYVTDVRTLSSIAGG